MMLQADNHACAGRRKGVAAILALAVLVILVIITTAMATQGFLEMRKSDSLSRSTQARLAAEGGLAYMTAVLREVRLSNEVNASTFMGELQTALAGELAPMNTAGVSVSLTAAGLRVSEIQLPHGAFSSLLEMDTSASPPSARLTVTGRQDEFTRQASVTFASVGKRSTMFDFGVASRGKIVISGSASITGTHSAGEASILSTRAQPVAIMAGGSATISGDLYVTGDDLDYIYIQGNGISIGGTSDVSEILRNHVFLGTQEPDFPEIDTAQFIPLAVNEINSTTNISGTTTFNNILIKAGTNPQFTSDTVINGVMYIEAPNEVTFAGKATINGLVVTADATNYDIDDCKISFRGSSSAPGVGALPNTAEFAEIKKYTGTVILAPGFDLSFRGTANSVNGLIAADKLSFIGNASIKGEVAGSIIGLKDYEMSLQGNADIRIARPDGGFLPAGFKHPFGLEPLAGTYSEPVN